MRRLICTFVVRIWHKQVFSWCGWIGFRKITDNLNKLKGKFAVGGQILWQILGMRRKFNQLWPLTELSIEMFFVRVGEINLRWSPCMGFNMANTFSKDWMNAFSTGKYVRMSHITRKPIFRVCDQVRLKPACSATETSLRYENLDLASIHIILSRQRQPRCWSDCADAQVDLRLYCSHMQKRVSSWCGSNQISNSNRLVHLRI